MKQKKVMSTMPIWLAGVVIPGLLWAGMANVPTQWEEGLENWVATSDFMMMQAANQNGAVVLSFPAKAVGSAPESVAGAFAAENTASYGMYAGDLLNIGAEGITFRGTGFGAPLSTVFLRLITESGSKWSYALVPPAVNETVTYQASFKVANWRIGGRVGDSAAFSNALSQVKKLELVVMQGGTTAAHGIILDDFKLIGPKISGAALYAGEQPGSMVRVVMEATSEPVLNQAVPRSYQASATAPVGTFEINDAAAPQTYRLKAFLDANDNGIVDFWEPRGEIPGGAFVFNSPMVNTEIVMADPSTEDGVPYWWLVKNCGATSEEQVRTRTGDDWIREWAGSNFTVRIINLGNGQVALRWKHIPGKQFQVEGGDTPGIAGLLEQGEPKQSLNSTGEEENEVIQSITGSSAKFYRVKLVTP
jgi:hypothetical protein